MNEEKNQSLNAKMIQICFDINRVECTCRECSKIECTCRECSKIECTCRECSNY
jgi:hypothetical protein